MTFQHDPEQFTLTSSSAHELRALPRSGTGTSEKRMSAPKTIMVQTPNGAAMMVPVYRRPEPVQSVDKPCLEVLFGTGTADVPSTRKSHGTPALCENMQVAAAPDR